MARTLRVLVVEDEWLIAQDHVDRIRKAGHQVVGPVPSVEKAITKVELAQIDAALLDVQLNDETSYPLADALEGRAIPFAFLTGFGPGEIPKRFAHIQVLQKPVVPAELDHALAVLSGA